MEWRGQVAVVTGGARGLGRATARLLAQRGAAVLVLALALIVLAATMWAAPPNAANDTAVPIPTGAIYRAQNI